MTFANTKVIIELQKLREDKTGKRQAPDGLKRGTPGEAGKQETAVRTVTSLNLYQRNYFFTTKCPETKHYSFTRNAKDTKGGAKMKTYYCVLSKYDDNGDGFSGIVDKREAEAKPKSTFKSTRNADIYTDWFESFEEADSFCKEQSRRPSLSKN